jgi:DNA-binding MarR family transcriptional regulator
LILKKRSDEDGRSIQIMLTKKGKNEFEILNEASNTQIKNTLAPLTDSDCEKLTRNMNEIKWILSKSHPYS